MTSEEKEGAKKRIGGFGFFIADVPLRVLAAVLAISLLYAALHDVSQAYDVWYYHLPFAARLGGVMDAGTYAFAADNQARYVGFPLFAELLQGIIWRISGHVQATNLVALAAVFALPLFLRRLFGVPLHLSFIALLAIPLVQMHATSSYVDLPANACVTMLLLLAYSMLAKTLAAKTSQPPSLRTLVAAVALAALTANMKFQLVPIVLAASLVIAIASIWANKGRRAKTVAILVVAVPIIFITPIENTIVHRNPVWPVELHALGHTFPFVERAYSQSPPHLENAPRPVRFVRSALEIDNRPIESHRRWSFDQWAPPSDPSSRMGGYFGAYVIVNLAALAFAALLKRTRAAIVAATFFGGVTIVAACVPQSHELRYYMHWMLLLVSLNLTVWTGDVTSGAGRSGAPTLTPTPTPTNPPFIARLAAGVIATAALIVVAWSTSGVFLYASGSTFAEYIDQRVEKSILENAAAGERLCIAKQPFTFLYAPTFHREKRYAVQEATSEADCVTPGVARQQPAR